MQKVRYNEKTDTLAIEAPTGVLVFVFEGRQIQLSWWDEDLWTYIGVF